MFEVTSDHMYRVGEAGVLVHNASKKKKACENPCAGMEANSLPKYKYKKK